MKVGEKKRRNHEDDGHLRMAISMYTWNPNVPCFDWKRPSFGGKTKDKWVPGI